ncbi:MAG TPA: ABC transporter permease [Burkholderiales bacterium]|nr:ABC transporter permease [Burkholderiales bacterium]
MSGSYLLKRLLWALPTLAGVAVVVFVLVRVVPGDPIAMMLPPGATAEDVGRLRALYGLDAPIAQQFAAWAGQVLRGDFGVSISLRDRVAALILGRLPATLELVLAAVAAACVLATVLAVAAVRFRGRWPELVVDSAAGLTLAIPDFLWGLLFILVLGVLLPWFPISGRIDPTLDFDPATGFHLVEALLRLRWDAVASLVWHMVLPALALALPLAAALTRVLKGSLVDAMNQDYAVLARTKGYSRTRTLWRVALRNALIPTVTLTGVQFSFLVGGTVLVEHIFSYPGIGNLAIAAVIQRDLPLIQGLILTFALLFILTNLAVDLAYGALNPRVKQA